MFHNGGLGPFPKSAMSHRLPLKGKKKMGLQYNHTTLKNVNDDHKANASTKTVTTNSVIQP